MVVHRLPSSRPRRTRIGWISVAAAAFALLIAGRWLASAVIDYQWWKEIGQVQTWLNLYLYAAAPIAAATLIAFVVLWIAHARALKLAETGLGEHPTYARIATLGALLLAFLTASSAIDNWTIVRYLGSRSLTADATAWRDTVFGKPLSFYLFDLPFYSQLRHYLLALVIVSVLVYWLTARAWQLRYQLPELQQMREFDISLLRLPGGMESRFLRGAIVIFLLALACKFFLGRYEMVLHDHGFMVGVDYVDANITLPLQWLLVAACILAAAFVWSGRWVLAAAMASALVIEFIVPKLVSSLYVKPNEISLERSYIQDHIHATRAAYRLEERTRAIEYKTQAQLSIDPVKHKNLLDNVRLWDWRAFHDTVTQSQALRQYYVFADTDVDRYTIDGQYRQVMLAPRELDIRQLPDARASWINPHFIYTHGYGLALAEVSKITPDGLPVYLIGNMPPDVKTSSLKIALPQLYYSEIAHEPVFVHTAQEELDYPSGAENVKGRYAGKGGFPVSSLPMRLAAAVHEGDANILLTNYLTPDSRMMIRRKVQERLRAVAAFLEWDADPYLVITSEGRLVWMADGYTTSDAHPYSRAISVPGFGRINYIRNSIKATVDAYDGETRLYIFEPKDPVIQAYRNLFPELFHAMSEMPADLRAHARYPETLFRIQTEIYRAYHMLNPQAFYNKEDLWELARYVGGQNGAPQPSTPTYVVATLPGEDKPEFLLMMSFTPLSKENLIGVMLARCDGENLGEIIVLQLSKQELTLGPMQIAARINQDQNISKDLTLWNQQGSQVLRGQTLVLPVDNTFLYVEPIYIQATEARMPQLKKVVLALGNRLVYEDTYEKALSLLSSGATPAIQTVSTEIGATPGVAAPPPRVPQSATTDARLESIRNHLRRYREFAGQGKWTEAGRELEAIESEARK
ncbi:MAG: UPF0182 family protein [Acidobacteriota bacterium]|nr:UPF0182 family protein [Acidobacteriota bacterium]